MKPLALSICYVVVVLIVHVSGEERLLSENVKTVNGPYHFNYASYDQIILFELILKNISPNVTKIYVINSSRLNFTTTNWTQDKIRVDKEVINGEVTIPLRRNLLQYQHILIDVELETAEGLCSKTKVTEGRFMDFSENWVAKIKQHWHTNWTYNITSFCQPPNICEIVIDLHNQCKEIFSCDYNATKYTCTLKNKKRTPTYQLVQFYNVRAGLTKLHLLLDHKLINTKLIMELETFDNNTSVNVFNVTDNKHIRLWGYNMNLTAKDVVKDIIVGTLHYSESTDIQYSCEKYISHPKIYSAFIVLYTKGNEIKQIKLMNKTPKRININSIKMEDNGSILCCLYYSQESVAGYMQITRAVVNKTLLIYQPKELATLEAQNSIDKKTSNSTAVTILYSLCGVCFTALVIVGIWRCWSAWRPQGTHGLPVINQPTEPFYLNMLFRRQCNQEIAEIDQHYEEIDQHHTPGVVRG